MMSGQFDFTNQFPVAVLAQAKAAPMLQVQEAKPNFQLLYYGFKTTAPLVSDRRVREAMSIAINRAEIAKGVLIGNGEPAVHLRRSRCAGLCAEHQGHHQGGRRARQALLDEAGWKPGADGIREKDGVKLAPKVYYASVGNSPKVSEAIQGYMRKIGVDWRLQPWDSTIAAAKMAEQDYEIWTVTVPYLSAGDLMSIYFDSQEHPDAEPHELEGRADRRSAGACQGGVDRRGAGEATTCSCRSG